MSIKGVIVVIDTITSTAMSLSQHQLELEVGARLVKTAKESVEVQGEAILSLLESAKLMELSVNPHLGSLVDLRG